MIEQNDIVTVDFKALFVVLWSAKWLVVFITLLFLAGGAYKAFTAREEFISEGKILPEVSGGGGSSLGGLANLVGIGGFELGLKNTTDAIRPDLYPDVIGSTPFYLNLFKQTFQTKDADTIVFENYFHQIIEENKDPKEKELKEFIAKPNGVIVVNSLIEHRIIELRERIVANIDKKNGVIKISAKMPDPVIAAQVAAYAMDYLTSYVTQYRTEKIKQEVDFLGRKLAVARGEFHKDQERKATYADQFSAPTIRFQSADIQRERLESEYKLSSNLYNELLQKYEEAKIKLQQETPVFQVLDPPVVPTFKSEPKKSVILLISFISGLITSMLASLLYRKNFKLIFK